MMAKHDQLKYKFTFSCRKKNTGEILRVVVEAYSMEIAVALISKMDVEVTGPTVSVSPHSPSGIVSGVRDLVQKWRAEGKLGDECDQPFLIVGD